MSKNSIYTSNSELEEVFSISDNEGEVFCEVNIQFSEYTEEVEALSVLVYEAYHKVFANNDGYEVSVTARKGGVEKDVTPLYELPYLIKNIKNLNI